MMGREEILDYAIKTDRHSAMNLLMLIGPDGYRQSYANYQDLMYWLSDGEYGTPIDL